MVSPGSADDSDELEESSALDNPWKEDEDEETPEEDGSAGNENSGTEETESDEKDSVDELDGEAEIATADVHEDNIRVDDDVGDINSSTSTSDLSDAEIDDEEVSEDEEVDVETAEVEEEDVKSQSERFGFDETEDEEDEDDGSGSGEESTDLGSPDSLEKGGQIADDINNGVASLGVVGIEDEETQEDLREDFFRTARDFRLGYYGEECVQEYFLSDGEDEISPVWGLVFASMVCAAVFAFRRPDTEELGGKVSDAIGSIGEGFGGASS